jgi:hypothetical protein
LLGHRGTDSVERQTAARPDHNLRLSVQRLEHRQFGTTFPGGYTQAADDSPLSDGKGGYLGGTAGTPVNTTSTTGAYAGTLTGYTASTPGGPIWKGTTPSYKNAASFNQWFNDDATVNKTFTAVLEMPALAGSGTNTYQYASKSHLAQGGFFPSIL